MSAIYKGDQKQHVKHWFFATMVAGAGKGNFQLPDTAAVSPFAKLKQVHKATNN